MDSKTAMTAAAWVTAVAACGSVVSASVAVFVAFYAVRAHAAQIKAADFNNCLEVVKQLGEAQRKVHDAKGKDEEKFRFEFHELLNLMEALALLINNEKIAPSGAKFASHFLREAIAYMEVDDSMRSMAAASITSDETYAELRQFQQRNGLEINLLIHRYREGTVAGADERTAMDNGQVAQYEATLRRQEQEHRMRFDRALCSDRAAVDIGIGVVRTAILINSGGLIAMVSFVGQRLGKSEPVHSLVSASEWFVGGLVLSVIAFAVAYIYQSIVTVMEQHWLSQLSIGSDAPPSRLARWSNAITGCFMVGCTLLSVAAFSRGAVLVVTTVDALGKG